MTKYFLLIIALCGIGKLNAQPAPYTPFAAGEQSILLTTGVHLKYVEQGNPDGIPLILLHGFTDSWHSYETVLPQLSSRFHVFVLSQRGHGDSEKPNTGYHPTDLAADLAAFMTEKNIRQAVIGGHSMGGMIAQQFTLDYPAMVKALVIIGSDASFKDNPGVPEFSAEINKLSDTVSYEFAKGFQQSTCAQPIDSVYFKLLVNETMKVPGRVWKAAMNAMMKVDLTGRLKEIKVPVMILWGDQDVFCTKKDQDRMRSGIPQAEFIVYEGTGHSMHWEKPEKFAGDLLAFVEKNKIN